MLLPIVLVLLCIPLAIATIRTCILRRPHPGKTAPSEQGISPAVEKLSRAITFRTVCDKDPDKVDWSQFDKLAAYLGEAFPLASGHGIPSDSPHNLIYRFEGTDLDAEPALLTAHQDVVPANDEEWEVSPFAGTRKDGYVWGRGSFDCKHQLISILQAFEELLSTGRKPKRTWYVAFGCDEEVNGGTLGAPRIAKQFERMGLTFSLVLDEGGAVAERYIGGIERPIAVVGVAEKGYADAVLSCSRNAGHSSTPKMPTALGHIGRAITAIEGTRHPVHYPQSVRHMIRNIGRQAPFGYAFLFCNLWLTKPLLNLIFSRNPTMNALIRTTSVPTVIHAGSKSNVIERNASVIVNSRLLPGEDRTSIETWLEKTVDDPEISIDITRFDPPSAESPVSGPAFTVIEETIASIFPDAIVTSYLMLGATDARQYQNLSSNIYRFTPAQMDRTEIARMHGTDERMSEENVGAGVRFFSTLIQHW